MFNANNAATLMAAALALCAGRALGEEAAL